MTAPTKITVWNVEHGVCIYIITPNNKKVILDCGSSQDFSPAIHLYEDLNVTKIHYLVISHPHDDHIRDIGNLDYYYKGNIAVFHRNQKITKDVISDENPEVVKPPNDKKINKYFEIDKRFNQKLHWQNDPTNPEWGKGCTIHTLYNNNKELEINDQSVISFVKFGSETILYGGDLKEKGWLELLENNNEFVKFLNDTTILIASHHGNKSGFCSQIFKQFSPKLTIISAGKYRDYDGTSEYDHETTGMTVHHRSNGDEPRKVISTRNDGHIELKIYDDWDTEVTID